MRLPGGFGMGGFGRPPMGPPVSPMGGGGFPRAVGPERFNPGIRSFDKLKGKKKIKKSGVYKLKKGETVVGKRKKGNTAAYVAGKRA